MYTTNSLYRSHTMNDTYLHAPISREIRAVEKDPQDFRVERSFLCRCKPLTKNQFCKRTVTLQLISCTNLNLAQVMQ